MQDSKNMKIGVIGSGIMGHGIAQTLARYGYTVIMNDISMDFLQNGMQMIKSGRFGLEKAVSAGKMKKEEADQTLSRISVTINQEDLKDCDLIIEAITEDEKVKGALFKKLDSIVKKSAIFASNTSGIMISSLSSYTTRGKNFIGMHWFNPPQVMKLVEVVKGPETTEDAIHAIVSISESAEKVPIIVNDGPGFFTTRFLNSWLMESYRMFESGVAGISEIDRMSKLAFGFPMGPFELSDFIGLDTMLHVAEYMYDETKRPDYAPPTILKKLVLAGYLGNKKGSKGGWYQYYGIKLEQPDRK
jgi:3-hydroxybutyryl-CoA dehydrogenase